MNDIKTMTLPRLVAEYLDVGHSTDGRSLAAIDAELSRRQAMLDAAEGMAMAIPMEIGGLWEVAEYDEQQIEIMAHKEMHVAFLNNTTTGRRFAQHIVDLHNAAYRAAKGNS